MLVHAPKRTYYDHTPAWGKIPSVESEIALIRAYGAEVIALALNTEDCSLGEAVAYQRHFTEQLNLPVLLPLEEGVGPVIPLIQALIKPAHAH